jgi:hypothetical protein
MVTRSQDGTRKEKQLFSLLTTASSPTPSNQCEPATFAQAAKLQCWRDAMTSEYNVLLDLNVFID